MGLGKQNHSETITNELEPSRGFFTDLKTHLNAKQILTNSRRMKPYTTGIKIGGGEALAVIIPETCLLYTSPSPRDQRGSRMPSSA